MTVLQRSSLSVAIISKGDVAGSEVDPRDTESLTNRRMVVLEAPTWHDWPVAGLGPERYGYLVLFRLDPQACVAALEDEEASRAAALLPRDWFLGIIMSTGAINWPNAEGDSLLDFDFCLVGQGLPHTATASVPLGTSPPTSADRPPIPLDHALPWSDLYVHTYYNALTIVARIHHTGHVPSRIAQDEIARLRRLEVKDKHHRVDSPSHHLDPELINYDAASDLASSNLGADDLDSDDVRPVYDKLQQVNLYVELWLDPTATTGPPATPRAYADAVRELKRIWSEWGERQLRVLKAQRPALTEEWIRAVDDAHPAPPETEDLAQHTSPIRPLDDDAVLPEDAVDYRAEQDMLSRVLISARPAAPLAVAQQPDEAPPTSPGGSGTTDAAVAAARTSHKADIVIEDLVIQQTAVPEPPVLNAGQASSTPAHAGKGWRGVLASFRSVYLRPKVLIVKFIRSGKDASDAK